MEKNKSTPPITYEKIMEIGLFAELFLYSKYSDAEDSIPEEQCKGFKEIQVKTKKGIFNIIFCAHVNSEKCKSPIYIKGIFPACDLNEINDTLVINHGNMSSKDFSFEEKLEKIKDHLRKFLER